MAACQRQVRGAGDHITDEYQRLREVLDGGADRSPAGTGGGTGSGR